MFLFSCYSDTIKAVILQYLVELNSQFTVETWRNQTILVLAASPEISVLNLDQAFVAK